MSKPGLFQRRLRGFRIVEVAAAVILLTLVLGVYLAKAGAGRERADIADVEDQIVQEQDRMKLLRAEVAYLEQPERIERLSTQFLGLQPISAKHETSPESLALIAAGPQLATPAAPASGVQKP